MSEIDTIANAVLREMGCDPRKKPHWVEHIHKTIDRATGDVFRMLPDGYVCSRCGKHSWSKKKKCDGCNSVMMEG